MVEFHGGAGARVLAAAVAVVLALGAAACGSDDDDGGGGSSVEAQNGASDTRSAMTGDPKQQIKADYDAFIDDIYKGRWQQACDRYSAAYVKVYPKQIKAADTCVRTMKAEFGSIGAAAPRPWANKVELKGPSRGVIYAKTREENSGVPIKVVKEDGVWKLDGPGQQAVAGKGAS